MLPDGWGLVGLAIHGLTPHGNRYCRAFGASRWDAPGKVGQGCAANGASARQGVGLRGGAGMMGSARGGVGHCVSRGRWCSTADAVRVMEDVLSRRVKHLAILFRSLTRRRVSQAAKPRLGEMIPLALGVRFQEERGFLSWACESACAVTPSDGRKTRSGARHTQLSTRVCSPRLEGGGTMYSLSSQCVRIK